MTTAKDFYLVRTPLLPLEFLGQFAGLRHDQLPEKLKSVFSDAYLQETIYIASPELHQELLKWLQGSLTDRKEVNKLVMALFRYLLRMCNRCTPYGLFAGCAMGLPGPATAITLAPKEHHRKHCRLDMNYVAELTAMIARIPEIRAQLIFYPNNSLYEIAGTYRYAAFTIKNKFRHYDLTSVNSTSYLQTILEKARDGATINTLGTSIMDEDISAEEATEFIHELIDAQVLVSEMEPTVTGEEYFTCLINRLQTLEETGTLTAQLIQIRSLLQDQAIGIDKYYHTHALVKSLLTDTKSKDLVQTDLFLATTGNTISNNIIADINRQVSQLWKLTKQPQHADVQNFITAFRQRYEEQEIPLTIALDAEAGIGYGDHSGSHTDHTPLIEDIIILPAAKAATITRSKMQEFQQQQLLNCIREGQREIVISDAQVEELKETDAPVIPDSLYLMGSILGASAEAVDAGDYQFEMNGCSGPSAANLLGRFCHGDADLTEKVKACLQEEAARQPDAIFAEVIHLPESRTGNILLRPQLRDFEIVYLGNSLVPADHQLPLSDLMVSIQHNQVVLRSKKWNKRVIPRLSTAHNYRAGGLPAYRFLCDLQYQQLHTGLSWQWQLATEETFLPRVRYGKIILAKCTWVLQKKDYPGLKEENNYTGIVSDIREKLALPRYVVIAEGDNELLIDLEQASCQHLLASILVKREKVTLQEVLSTSDNCWITGEGGHYTNELIIPLQSTPDKARTGSIPLQPREQQQPARRFITGSEWLYVKVYGGTSSTEKILKTVIRPLTDELMAEGVIDKWFFIRYADPENHVRIRLHHATDKGFWKEVLERLHAALEEVTSLGLSYKVQTDTYEREIERYGTATMEISEDIFCFDSQAVLHCIDLLDGDESETYRWLLAARGTDMLLNDFGYDLMAKAELLKRMQFSFFTEFGGGKPLQTQLNDKYREHMRRLTSMLDPLQDTDNEIEEATAIFNERSVQIAAALEAQGFADNKKVFHELMSSYIHMFLNRMLLSNQRKHELVIYHFLSRYYESRQAIAKKQLQPQ